jgi:hypothetical protein
LLYLQSYQGKKRHQSNSRVQHSQGFIEDHLISLALIHHYQQFRRCFYPKSLDCITVQTFIEQIEIMNLFSVISGAIISLISALIGAFFLTSGTAYPKLSVAAMVLNRKGKEVPLKDQTIIVTGSTNGKCSKMSQQ